MNADHVLLTDSALIVFCVMSGGGGYIWMRKIGCTLAEAWAYSLLLLLMIQSWLGQVLLMAGAPFLYVPFLFISALPWIKVLRYTPRVFAAQIRSVMIFLRVHPVATSGLMTIWGYTAVVCAWPMVRPDGSLFEALHPLWRHSGSVFTIGRTAPDLVLPVLNHVVFAAPWQPPLATALANLCAYLTIGFGSYALARRYAWPSMAVTVTLLIVSMTRLVHQSLSVNSELLPAAAALTVILALYRAVERLHYADVMMLASALAFSVSGGRLCYLMPAVLAALSLVVLGRRHSIRLLAAGAASRIRTAMVSVAIVGVFSQAWIVSANLAAGRAWIGAAQSDQVIFNSDALSGTVANLARYALLTIDLPEFIDRVCQWSLGFSLLGVLRTFYQWTVAATLDGRGAAAAFDLSWTAPYKLVWFGPAGFFLVMPSLFIAVMRGPRRLKSTALAMLVYWALIALIVAWRPGNAHLMTPFFVCSGFFMAFALPPWRLGRNGRLLLQILGIMIMAHAILA